MLIIVACSLTLFFCGMFFAPRAQLNECAGRVNDTCPISNFGCQPGFIQREGTSSSNFVCSQSGMMVEERKLQHMEIQWCKWELMIILPIICTLFFSFSTHI